MSSEKRLEELSNDLEELNTLLSHCVRVNNKNALTAHASKLNREIEQLKKSAEQQTSVSADSPKRYEVELIEYAFDQSDKFVKLFVTLDGVQTIPENNVNIAFTENSLTLTVKDLNGKDYRFVINSLLERINVEKSYRKIKTDMIAIYAKKVKEGKNWSHLTVPQKKLADEKASAIKDTSDDMDPKDPTAGLFNIMKKMYETGDPETKRMINKAWVEGQEQKMKGGDGLPDL